MKPFIKHWRTSVLFLICNIAITVLGIFTEISIQMINTLNYSLILILILTGHFLLGMFNFGIIFTLQALYLTINGSSIVNLIITVSVSFFWLIWLKIWTLRIKETSILWIRALLGELSFRFIISIIFISLHDPSSVIEITEMFQLNFVLLHDFLYELTIILIVNLILREPKVVKHFDMKVYYADEKIIARYIRFTFLSIIIIAFLESLFSYFLLKSGYSTFLRFLFIDGDYQIMITRLIYADVVAFACLVFIEMRRKNDITQMKIQERDRLLHQAQKMDSIGKLSGGMAHDFNNFLQVMTSYIELLEMDSELKDPELIQDIRKSVQNASQLTKTLLSFSRKSSENVVAININNSIDNLCSILEHTFPKNILIETSYKTDSPQVLAETSQMEQILMNIAINAKDAMENGGKLRIETTSVYLDRKSAQIYPNISEGRYTKIKMSDTGRGMNELTLNRIFEPFFTTKQIDQGTGLGLFIIYGIIQTLNGDITVESQKGKGTTFTIFLPEVSGNDLEKQKQNQPIEKIKLTGDLTLLFIDDEISILDLINQTLPKLGYDIYIAEDGLNGLEIFMSPDINFDVVILDLNMPKMDGITCLKKIKEFNSNQKVMIATGSMNEDKEDELYNLGANAIIYKPYSIEKLISSIKDL